MFPQYVLGVVWPYFLKQFLVTFENKILFKNLNIKNGFLHLFKVFKVFLYI